MKQLLTLELELREYSNNNCQNNKLIANTTSKKCNHLKAKGEKLCLACTKWKHISYLLYSLNIFTPFPSFIATPFFLMKCISSLLQFSCLLP